MTYAETRGEQVFSFYELLKDPNPDYREVVYAHLLSESFVTCAVGNQCARIPRDEFGIPEDGTLRRLGWEFYGVMSHLKTSFECVYPGEIEFFRREALAVLWKIEDRSCEILEAMEYEECIAATSLAASTETSITTVVIDVS